MSAGRTFVGIGVSSLLIVGALTVVTSSASAIVAPDKMVLLSGAKTAAFGDVTVANADGSGEKIIHKGTKTQAPDSVAVAPTNNRIIEVFDDESKKSAPSGIAVMNIDGSGYRVLVKAVSTSLFFSRVRWNTAGTKALVSVENMSGSYLATLDTRLAHPALVRVPGSNGLRDGAYATTTDATIVATEAVGNLLTMTGTTKTTVLAAPSTGSFISPSYAPGDATIVFGAFSISGSSLVSRIETVAADGMGGPTVLAGTGFNLNPEWSSDGSTVYFQKYNTSNDTAKIYRIAADGMTAPTEFTLTSNKMYVLGSLASPDSTSPGAVSSMRVTLDGASPVLSWHRSADADVSHYVVRRATGLTAPIAPTHGVSVYHGPNTSAVDTVTPGQTYTYGVWAVDGAGNASPVLSKTFVALRAPVLIAPPLVSKVSLDTTFPVRWAPTHPNAPGTTYTVQRRLLSGTWTAWQNSVTTTSATFGAGGLPVTPVAGKTYALRAFVTDIYGNASARTTVTWVEPKDDRSASVKGSWKGVTGSKYWLGTARTTSKAKASLSLTLTGSTLWIIGDRLAKGSNAAIYVDGKLVKTIDTHGSLLHRHVLWTKKVKAGKHRVRIVNLASSGRTHLSIDAFAAA